MPDLFPIYIPTRGRPETQLTAARLTALGLRPRLVVEESERDLYAAHNPDCDVLVWPTSYMDDYERTPELDPHPTTGAAHNFAWDHARSEGATHHWIMDDNIKAFYHRNLTGDGSGDKPITSLREFDCVEQVALAYRNLAGIALGLGHTFGAAPFTLNTRLYCATLYRNDLADYGIRWRRGLNDDTIVSLDILKTGYFCTAESHVLNIHKVGTSRAARLPGGMTDFYADGGFIRKAAELVRLHPDCTKRVVRYGRVHHQINYSQFTQRLIPVDQPTERVAR